jgi:hypothetical protein
VLLTASDETHISFFFFIIIFPFLCFFTGPDKKNNLGYFGAVSKTEESFGFLVE